MAMCMELTTLNKVSVKAMYTTECKSCMYITFVFYEYDRSVSLYAVGMHFRVTCIGRVTLCDYFFLICLSFMSVCHTFCGSLHQQELRWKEKVEKRNLTLTIFLISVKCC